MPQAERLDGETLAAANSPGHPVLLEGKRHLGVLCIVGRHYPDHQVRLPLAAGPVVPSETRRHEADTPGILQLGVGRYQPLPRIASPMHPVVETMHRHPTVAPHLVGSHRQMTPRPASRRRIAVSGSCRNGSGTGTAGISNDAAAGGAASQPPAAHNRLEAVAE